MAIGPFALDLLSPQSDLSLVSHLASGEGSTSRSNNQSAVGWLSSFIANSGGPSTSSLCRWRSACSCSRANPDTAPGSRYDTPERSTRSSSTSWRPSRFAAVFSRVMVSATPTGPRTRRQNDPSPSSTSKYMPSPRTPATHGITGKLGGSCGPTAGASRVRATRPSGAPGRPAASFGLRSRPSMRRFLPSGHRSRLSVP